MIDVWRGRVRLGLTDYSTNREVVPVANRLYFRFRLHPIPEQRSAEARLERNYLYRDSLILRLLDF